MSKITLGKPPKTFAPIVVGFKMPDGSDGRIEAVYRYRSRKAFGEFVRDHFKLDPEEAGKLDTAALVALEVDKKGAYLADVLDSWDLDEKLTQAAAEQLADEVPAAANALIQAYGAAVTEGRLGN